MYTTEKKAYKAKVGNLYVKAVWLSMSSKIELGDDTKFVRYLSEKEKDYLLVHFPDAEVKEVIIKDSESW